MLESNQEKSSEKIKGKTITKKEKLFLLLAVLIFLGSLIGWSLNYYFKSTEKKPANGGEFTEGYVGKILYVNPILSQSNEADAVLSSIIFSSLFNYDQQSKLKEDLVEKYEINNEGKTYKIKLKENVKWHDGTQFTAKDVIFTINLIKDPAFRSSLRGNFESEKIEMKDDYNLEFTLQEPFAPFLNKLTFGILPEHLFKDVPPENFLLNDLNIKPVGTGPFVFYDLKKDSQDNVISYQLVANENYYGQRPYFDRFNMNFYSNEEELIEAYNRKEVNGFGLNSYDKINQFKEKKDTQIIKIKIPRYFALFLNGKKSIPLADEKVREALSLATNKEEMIEKIFYGYGEKINSPILNTFNGINANNNENNFNLEKAKNLLEEAGWKLNNEGTRQKEEEKLEINITTTQWPALEQTAELIKSQWEQIGVKVQISKIGVNEFQQNYIRPRDYQAILFGQEYYGNNPDFYAFWHSNNKKDPGKNIAVYENEEVDKILEELRTTLDETKTRELYEEFTKKLTEDYPAIFLFSPDYVYIVNKKIKGVSLESIINPALRLDEISQWHVNIKRIKK